MISLKSNELQTLTQSITKGNAYCGVQLITIKQSYFLTKSTLSYLMQLFEFEGILMEMIQIKIILKLNSYKYTTLLQ